jgi:hypothetical protein
MATKKTNDGTEVTDLLRKLLIVQLGLAGVSQQNIRAVVGCDKRVINGIMKFVKPKATVKVE